MLGFVKIIEENEVFYKWGYVVVTEEALPFQIFAWMLSVISCLYLWKSFVMPFVKERPGWFLTLTCLLVYVISIFFIFGFFNIPYKLGIFMNLSHEGSVGLSVAVWSMALAYFFYRKSESSKSVS
ncbi:hypothetical protein HYO48_22000 [Vibrio parahaemolyticus]|nr:hypothetical protein [Vibrio parahaemolyticus]MBM4864695.1 hypothetical protein [Vibrio parahaemolyticus]